MLIYLHTSKTINKNQYLVHGVEMDLNMLTLPLSFYKYIHIVSIYTAISSTTSF